MSADLTALIERCKTADGPNFQLEQDIGAALDSVHSITDGVAWVLRPSDVERDQMQVMPAPAYTASADAVLELVERRAYRLWTIDASVKGMFSVTLASLAAHKLRNDEGAEYIGTDYRYGRAKSLPLAMCIALLDAALSPNPSVEEDQAAREGK